VILSAVTGVVYPLAVWLIGQTVLSFRANGSIIDRDGQAIGSELIGRQFEEAHYFWGRASATGPSPYTAFNAEKMTGSSGSNYGPRNPALVHPDAKKLTQQQLISLTPEEVEKLGTVPKRIYELLKADPGNTTPIPVDLVTASASGLDPHISPAAAEYQVSRVANARGLSQERVRELVAAHTEGRTLGVLGEPRVNVLRLNLALDDL
jgi:K+-transporting ATPase ATPase C chain